MSARTRPAPHPEPDPAVLLTALATEIDDAFVAAAAAGDPPGQLIRVVASPEQPAGIELGLLPLESGDHPADAMAGFTAPSNWKAVGVVTTGRSHEWSARADRPSRRAKPVRLTFLLDRTGISVTLLTPLGSSNRTRRTLRDPPDGLVADACRRVLGLPTPPPAEGLETWIVARWLDRLLAACVAEAGAVATWDQAVGLHPFIPSGVVPSTTELVALRRDVCQQFDWERLRLLAVRSQGSTAAIAPELATWLDAGSFSRHLLAAELPIDLLITELEALLPPAVLSDVRATLVGGKLTDHANVGRSGSSTDP